MPARELIKSRNNNAGVSIARPLYIFTIESRAFGKLR